MSDEVNNPAHYQAGGFEVIDIIEAFALNYRLGNVLKYVLRAGKKGDALVCLKKARWYLDREITAREQGGTIRQEVTELDLLAQLDEPILNHELRRMGIDPSWERTPKPPTDQERDGDE